MTRSEKIDHIKTAKPFKIADFVLFGVLAVAVALLFYFMYRPSGVDGEVYRAVVRVDGEVYGSYALNSDAEIDVDGKLRLVIADGEAYVTNAACPDKICEYRGRIRRIHDMIVCAPLGITVRIDGESIDRLPGAR